MSNLITGGVDIGAGCVKTVLFRVNGAETEWLGREVLRIRNRDPFQLAEDSFQGLLDAQGLRRDDVAYVASTGDAESLTFTTGHFYSMTTHARGAVFLDPEARAVMDVGALNGRAIRVDEAGKVLAYKMTSQCASGAGQFLENIARYLGIAQDEIGPLSQAAADSEKVSSICAVLAETDVINMVSRGIPAGSILRGVHVSMAVRMAKLLKSIGAKDGIALMTGGLGLDVGLMSALNAALEKEKVALRARSHPDAIHAGAIGAALWGAFRYEKLAAQGRAAA
jgi:benzoyl-CoA reductase subunit D